MVRAATVMTALAVVLAMAVFTCVRVARSHLSPALELWLAKDGALVASRVGDESTSFLVGSKLVEVNGRQVRRAEASPVRGLVGLNEVTVIDSSSGSLATVYWLVTLSSVSENGAHRNERLAGILGTRQLVQVDGDGAIGAAMKARTGELTRYTFSSPDSGVVEVIVQRFDWRVMWALFVVGVGFAVIGVGAFQLRPDTRSGWALLWFASYLALFWFLRAIPFMSRTSFESGLYLAVRCLIFVPTFYFMTVFSPLRRLVRDARWALGVGLLLGLGFYAGNWLVAPSWAETGALVPEIGVAWMVLVLLTLMVSLSADAALRLARWPLAALDRMRGHAFRLAFFAGFAPLAVYTIVRILSQDRFAEARILFELAVLLFPLILAYATVRHNLLQLNELLLEGVGYGAVLIGITVIYSIAVGGVAPVAEAVLPDNSMPITFAAVALMTGLAVPLHSRVRRTLDGYRERRSFDAESILAGPEAQTLSLDAPHHYFNRLAKRLSEGLNVPEVSILLRQPQTQDWWLAASTQSHAGEPQREACDALFREMTRAKAELARDVLEEALEMTELKLEVIRGLDELRAAIAFPLIVSEELWGILAVGDKATQTNYSFGEVRLLRRAARECALGLYHLHLRIAIPEDEELEIERSVQGAEPWPERIGSYEVERLLGEGAQAHVYLGSKDGRNVAIKVANQRVLLDPTLRRRFEREMAILRELDHRNVVAVLEAGLLDEGRPYMVMPYYSNGSLRSRLRREGRLEEPEALRFVIDVAQGLQAAHARGVVHRDVNPRNILLADHGAAIGDFGIAVWDGGETLTTHSQMLGTPGYLSPEVCEGKRPDWRADQYGLGVTLYELLAGKRPYRARHVMQVVAKHLRAEIPEVRNANAQVSERTSNAVRRMMAKEPEERFGSYDELLDELGGTT